MNKSYLVTGGAGFIGSHLVEKLISLGHRVRVLDNLAYGNRADVSEKAEFMEGDIRDLDSCKKAMEGMDGVFHMAAMSRVAPSLDNIELCTSVNITGTQNILLAAKDAGNRKVVYSASSTFYGADMAWQTETAPHGEFLNFYALTKYTGEEYVLLFDRIFGTPGVVLRYFNVYGQRQPQTGPYALVMGIFLRNAKEGKALEIHGEGKQRRDFVHVRDVVCANIMAMESDCHAEIFNVGSGANISIQELANLISDNQIHTARRPGDAENTLADITRIKNFLGWEPVVKLEEGLKELL